MDQKLVGVEGAEVVQQVMAQPATPAKNASGRAFCPFGTLWTLQRNYGNAFVQKREILRDTPKDCKRKSRRFIA